MIQKLCLYESTGFDPYRNLAVEESLLEQAENRAILYLWQNADTVVIGKNQNPWKECRTNLLNEEGGHLARRLSGGGAVFHDLGNLNFTILLPQCDYDLNRQLAVIQKAAASLGIPVERSGRNDLLVEGRKFSGNAFYNNGRQAYHHGTILVHTNMEKMARYLSPSKLKLQAKGVDSVRSRVENLCHWKPDITVAQMKAAMKAAFSQVYGMPLELVAALDENRISTLTERNRSWDWNYGCKIPFTCSVEKRFPWGSVEISLLVTGGYIQKVKVYTDSMQTQWAASLEKALVGRAFEKQAMNAAATAAVEQERAEDIGSLLAEI